MAAIDFSQHALCFRAVGSGIPIAALHGSAATARQWAPLSAYLGDEFRIIAPDMPGYGGSPAWAADHLDSDEAGPVSSIARRVSALLRSCGRPVHIVGHSAGGNIALAIALSYPDLVASLTLIEPVAFHLLASSDPADIALYREIQCLAGTIAADLANGDPQSGMARFIDFWNGDGAWERMPAGQQDNLAAQTGQVVGDFTAAFSQEWPIAELRSVSAPVHLVMGLRSQAVTMRITELIAESINDAALSMVADGGHMMPMTHPAEISRIIENHVWRSAKHAIHAAGHPKNKQPAVAA